MTAHAGLSPHYRHFVAGPSCNLPGDGTSRLLRLRPAACWIRNLLRRYGLVLCRRPPLGRIASDRFTPAACWIRNYSRDMGVFALTSPRPPAGSAASQILGSNVYPHPPA
jgi:hypothetical protein